VSKELDLAEGKEYGGQLQDQHLRDDRLDMVMAIKGHGEKGNDPVSQELLAEVHGEAVDDVEHRIPQSHRRQQRMQIRQRLLASQHPQRLPSARQSLRVEQVQVHAHTRTDTRYQSVYHRVDVQTVFLTHHQPDCQEY